MLAINIVLASANGYFYAVTHQKTRLTPPSDLLLDLYFASVIADSILVMISAIMLISAVFKIRKALGDMQGEINVKTLVLHSTAFILFAIGFLT